MNTFNKVYAVTSLIPKGKVLTYKQISQITKANPKIVGFALHSNKNPKKIPCHRVVKKDGLIAKGYAFGGHLKQREKLEKEGVCFLKTGEIDLEESCYKQTKALKIYFDLLFEFGNPGKWPWFNKDKPHSKEEIIIGSILTQNTNWKNVQKALDNLKNEKANNISNIYKLGQINYDLLKSLIRPSGYYNQKTERVFIFCKYLIENYKTLKIFSKRPLNNLRSELLSLKGIGKETADTILLYALNKSIFVIDAYTKEFVEKFDLTKLCDYDSLQKYFMENLPKDVNLYKDYHALIIKSIKSEKITA